MAPLLEIEDLRTEIQLKHGVVHAVDGVSLHVDPARRSASSASPAAARR